MYSCGMTVKANELQLGIAPFWEVKYGGAHMIWHDTRLRGQAPNIAPNTYTVNDTVDLTTRLDVILTMCGARWPR